MQSRLPFVPGKPAWGGLILLAVAVLLSGRMVAQPQGVAGPADADIGRGIQLMRGGQFAAAKAQFTAAVKADQKSASALTWRGICENQLKQYREASQDFEAALRIDSTAM